MRRGFTLVELMVVMGIMGLLGTASVGGYRAMQRGMADRGAKDNVSRFIRAAYQRAQIDRQPTAVYFWNETLREEDANGDVTEIVVGKAVAIRRYGRITRFADNCLFDEFADLNQTYQTSEDEGSDDDKKNQMYIYPIDDLGDLESDGKLKRSLVYGKVYDKTNAAQAKYLTGNASGALDGDVLDGGNIPNFAFKLSSDQESSDQSVQWKSGMAYGFEFARIELPHGYVFGSGNGAYSKKVSTPVQGAGCIVFDVGTSEGNGMVTDGDHGRDTVEISSLRPGKDGSISAQSIGKTESPTRRL